MAATSAVARHRLQDLIKARCRIFSHRYNPSNTRNGAWVLRQRLKGSLLAAYYPRTFGVTNADIRRLMPQFDIFDEQESDWQEALTLRKAKGKGNPKKKKTAEESKRFRGRKSRPVAPAPQDTAKV